MNNKCFFMFSPLYYKWVVCKILNRGTSNKKKKNKNVLIISVTKHFSWQKKMGKKILSRNISFLLYSTTFTSEFHNHYFLCLKHMKRALPSCYINVWWKWRGRKCLSTQMIWSRFVLPFFPFYYIILHWHIETFSHKLFFK